MDVLHTTDTRDDPATRARGTWVRLTRVGGIAFIVSQVVMVAAGAPIMLVVPIALITAAFTAFLTAERRWLAIGFAVFAVALLAVSLPFALADLGHPESAPSFIPQLVTVVTLTATAVGALGVALGWAPGPARPVVLGAGGVVVIALAGSLLAWTMTPSHEPQPTDVAFGADGFAWESTVVSFEPTASGALWVDNRDGGRHVLAVPELGISAELPASKARRVEIGDVPAGEYDIVCTIPGHERMTATLIVAN